VPIFVQADLAVHAYVDGKAPFLGKKREEEKACGKRATVSNRLLVYRREIFGFAFHNIVYRVCLNDMLLHYS
jgi:hypothetical protein